jgi:hypothetical protein
VFTARCDVGFYTKQIMFCPKLNLHNPSWCLDSGIWKSYEYGKYRLCFFVRFRALFNENGLEILQCKKNVCLFTIIRNCTTDIKTMKLVMTAIISEGN